MSITIDNKQPTGNELFRFVNVRGSRNTKLANKRISNINLNQSYIINNNISTYISSVINNAKNANKEEALQGIMQDVSTFKSSANYIKSTSDLETEFENVFLANEEISELAENELTFDKINSILDAHLSNERTAISTTELLPQEIKLWENIIAQLINPDDAYVRVASISLLKTYHLLRLCSQTDADKKLSDKNIVQDAVNARVVLPSSIFPLPQVENNTTLPKTEQQKFTERQKLIAEGREKLAEEWHKYHDALTLFDKKTDCYQSNTLQDKNLSEYNNAIAAYHKAMFEYVKALAIYNKALEADPNYSGTKPVEPIIDEKYTTAPHFNWDELPLNTKSDLELLQIIKKVTCLSNPIPYTPVEGSTDETTNNDGEGENPPNYKTYNVSITKTRKGLLNQIKDLSSKIASTIKPYDLMIPIGNSMVKLKTNYIPADFEEEVSGSGGIEKGYTILGVGDLLKVEQEILCYEAGEVAHIENVMKGEYKDRSTRDFTHHEETTITEEETITEEKRDLETTDRSEMNKEASTVISNDFSIDQGVLISGKFGPVKVETSTNVSVGGNTSTQNSSAVNFSKSVTERASNRIQKRIRKETRITIIKEFEEINKHGFENRQKENAPAVEGHIVGIYRWVNKVYRNTLWNYGKRMMLEFMVPEPSAYHIYAKANSSTGGIKAPLHPKDYEVTAHVVTTTTDKKGNVNTAIQDINYKLIDPTVLTEYNYMLFAAGYDADILPPPTATSIGKSFSEQPTTKIGNQSWDEKLGSSKCEVTIPEGYYCYACDGVFSGVTAYESDGRTPTPHSAIIKVYTQPNVFSFNNGTYLSSQGVSFSSRTPINVTKILPISVSTFNLGGFALNVIAHCKPTDALFEKWQLDTYNAIMQAYYQKVSEYEQKLSRLQIINGVQIQGSNPLQYQTIIKNELKKACIQIMANENFDKTSANFLQTEGYDEAFEYKADPTLNVANSVKNAAVIRFFEQTFEWDQMTYLFYPYFWANKSRWIDLYNLDDNDPLFANFLKAGAARVVVPVRPGFEPAFAYFNKFYKIPESAVNFTPDDPTYLSIAAELKPNYEREFVESWDNVLPTNLVILQNDASGLEAVGLPCWKETPINDPVPTKGIGSMEVS